MFPITVTLHDERQLQAVLIALGKGTGQAVATGKVDPASERVVDKKATAAVEKATEVKAAVEDKPTEDAGKVYTLDDAKKLTTDVVKGGKRAEMVALLAKFGVQQAVKLPEDKVTAFCTEAEALLS